MSAQSASDAWAVGSVFSARFTEKTLILRWNGTSWAEVPSANRGGFNDFNVLSAVSALSPSNAWAVGNTFFGTAEVQKTLIEHWNGAAWSLVPSPNPGPVGSQFDAFNGLSAVSPANIWAVGTTGALNAGTFIVHWNGTSWTRVASPSLPAGGTVADLLAVSATSASDAWAVGQYASSAGVSRSLVLHWNGTSWTRVTSPDPGGSKAGPHADTGTFLSGVSAVSPSNAWAVGYYLTSENQPKKTLILHWNGVGWTQVASPDPGQTAGSSLAATSALAGSGAWAAGSYLSGTQISKTLVLHWNGYSWTQVASPSPPAGAALNAIGALTPGNAWAVGATGSSSSPGILILRGTAKAGRDPDPATEGGGGPRDLGAVTVSYPNVRDIQG